MTGGARPVPVARVFEYAVEQITATASELWPDNSVRLGEHVPTLTSYVHRIWVGEHPMVAKYNFLGSSLAAVLRGTHGGWAEIEPAQRRYVHTRDALLAREAEQLYLLAATRQLRAAGVTDFHNGVLFTAAITKGTPLDELMLAKPQLAPTLLRRAWAPITRVHRLPGHDWPAIPERDIVATFSARFLADTRGTVHLGQARSGIDPEAITGLRYIIRRLRTFPVTQSRTGLVYGEVTPGNIIMTGGEPIYPTPGMHIAPAIADLAKLVSRLLLTVLSRVPATNARHHILAGLTDLIRAERSTVPIALSAWMVELLTLVARDAANILSTYITAPESSPLPNSAVAVLDRVEAVVPVFELLVTGLVRGLDPDEIWARVTAEVVGS